MKKRKKIREFLSLNSNSLRELTDAESQQICGGQGILQEFKSPTTNPGELRGVGTSPLFANPFAP